MIATPGKVIDASALAAVLFDEPEGERISTLIGGEAMIAPSLLPFEITNVCLNKLRRHPERRNELFEAYDMMFRIRLAYFDVDHGESLRLAETTGLTAYDASYLWLARELGADLVTLDRRLAAFAPSPGTP